MSYSGMLAHRCRIKELQSTFVDGVATSEWKVIKTNVRCFLDLNFLRKGKDPMWTPEAGRPSDRSGVLFVEAGSGLKAAHRVEMTKGPSGTFTVEGAIDEAWRPTSLHHIEVGVVEVPQGIASPTP